VIRWVYPAHHMSIATHGHIIGRDPSCHTVLEGGEVSRRHVEIVCSGALPVLRDLDSRNGLFVNGLRVPEQRVGPQDIVRVGEWLGVVVEGANEQLDDDQLHELVPGWFASAGILRAVAPLRRAVQAALPIVVQGETGAGKEGIARAAHVFSGRPGPFLAIDCGALPEHLVEGQLFGYRKGAFTGADRPYPGLFRAADGGTLFLDEVLNLTAPLQAKLLRVLEQREVLPLGESRPVPIDVRVVCAAQESLAQAADDGRLRKDLLARLDGFTFVLTPLRGRKEDIVALFRQLLAEHGNPLDVEPRFIESLLLYDWPLNVRELVLTARRLLALAVERPWSRQSLPARIQRSPTSERAVEVQVTPRTRAPTDDADAFEALVASLREHEGNLTHAVAALGMTRSRAYRLFAAHPEQAAAARKSL
jgi:transcriptional regulator with PAS, ATPase and Fis domain